MTVSHYIETQTGWSIKKFVRTARRYRTVTIQAGNQTLTAAEPPPPDRAEILTKIHGEGAQVEQRGQMLKDIIYVLLSPLIRRAERIERWSSVPSDS